MNQRRAAEKKRKLQANIGEIRAEPPRIDDPIELLVARARKFRVKGDLRSAAAALRQACGLDEWRARTWTLLGALLADAGQRVEAARAFNQARWLRARAGDKARAAVTEGLAARLSEAA